MDIVANLVLFTAVKKFWKSVKIWQSYRSQYDKVLGGPGFLEHGVVVVVSLFAKINKNYNKI